MTGAQFTTMKRESSSQGQFWQLDETVWQLAKQFPDSADREKTTKQDHAQTTTPLEDRQATQEECGPVLPAGRESTGRTCLTHLNTLGSCLSQSRYAIVLPVLVADIF